MAVIHTLWLTESPDWPPEDELMTSQDIAANSMAANAMYYITNIAIIPGEDELDEAK